MCFRMGQLVPLRLDQNDDNDGDEVDKVGGGCTS
jgi:hypothetical protein